MASNNVDVSSNLRPELTPPLGEMLGYQAATNPIWDLAGASGFLVVSSNMTEEQNVAAVPIKKAVQEGASLIVIDPRETELTRYASIWLRPRPGSETALIGGMIRVIVDESLDDHDFLAGHCDGVDELKNSLWEFDLIKVVALTAIPKAEIQQAARLLARSGPCAILYALETVAPPLRSACVRALVNLALATGNVGKPSAGLYPLYPGANEQGARDVGCVPDYLPGYRSTTDGVARRRLQREWGAEIPSGKGLSIKDITPAIREGRVKSLLVMGDSLSFGNGDLGDFLSALKDLELLVVTDAFPSELTRIADAVLPSVTFAEKRGTYTNMERRVQLLQPALEPRGDEDADWRIISQIARRMGATGFDHHDAESVFSEINNLVPGYGGITYQRLRSGGLQWPCLAADMADTPVLYANNGDDRKLRLVGMTLPEEQPVGDSDSEFPFLLARGRLLHQSSRSMEIVKLNKHNVIQRDEILEFHEEDARALGISEGEWVEVASAREKFRGIVRLSSPHKGLISMTTLFGELVTALERSEEPDPMLKVEGLPLVAVRVDRIAEAAAD